MENEKTCLHCRKNFKSRRADKSYCSERCQSAAARKRRTAKKATHASEAVTTSEAVTARILSDGFYLGDLRREIERICKTPGLVAFLEMQFAKAVDEDAIWPVGTPGRIALLLALLKFPSLRTRATWRHPHEKRRRRGTPHKPSGALVHARISRAGVI
jgi:hypothetical protein